MPEGAGSIGISPCTRQSQGGLDSGIAHGQRRYTVKKSLFSQVFPMIGIWLICGRCDGEKEQHKVFWKMECPQVQAFHFPRCPTGAYKCLADSYAW
jgi:hypothetical protein